MMDDEPRTPEADPPDEPPVQRIAGLMIDPSPGFAAGLARRINRRVLGNDLIELSFGGWLHAIVQYVLVALGMSKSERQREEDG